MSSHEDGLGRELRSLVAAPEPDWADVLARGRRLEAARSRQRRTVAVALLAVLVLSAGTAYAVVRDPFGWFTVSRADETAPLLPESVPYVAGRVLSLPGRTPQQLSEPLLAPLLGQDATLAVASPDGGSVVYHSWRDDVPLLLLHDVHRGGGDRVLARAAHTLAWRADGALAYLQLEGQRMERGPYLGHVVVRMSAGAPPRRLLARRGEYEVLAWARETLLVRVARCLACPIAGVVDHPPPGLYALDRPDTFRRLPLATLAALSPDGRLALGRHDPVPGQDSPSAHVRVVEVATGRVTATLDLTPAVRAAGLRGSLPGTLQSAVWRGSEVVATFAGRDSAIVLLEADDRRLEVRRVIRVPPRTLPSRSGVFFGTPALALDGRLVVPLRGSGGAAAVVLVCDLVEERCTRGRRLGVREWFSVLGNPSRPSPRR